MLILVCYVNPPARQKGRNKKTKKQTESVIVTRLLTVSYCTARITKLRNNFTTPEMIEKIAKAIHNLDRSVMTLTVPLELFIPFMLIFVTNLTVGAVSGYLGPHSTFRLYILFS